MTDWGTNVGINLPFQEGWPLWRKYIHDYRFQQLRLVPSTMAACATLLVRPYLLSVGAVTDTTSGLRPSMHFWPRGILTIPRLANTRLIYLIGGPCLELSAQRRLNSLHLEPIPTLCGYLYDSQLCVSLLLEYVLAPFLAAKSVNVLSAHDPEASRLLILKG